MERKRIPQVGIIMSSEKDLPYMEIAAKELCSLGIPFDMTALSPYRLPDEVREYGRRAARSGYEVIIAGSGGSNELACMVASYTCLPIIGVPLRQCDEHSVTMELAAILSTLETPPGVPVATVGFNDVVNAAILATEILAVKDHRVRTLLREYRRRYQPEAEKRADQVISRGREMQS